MKAITIKQPFATLIAKGLKEYEFRTWKTKYRGDILIHAAKGVDKKAMKRFSHLNLDYPQGCIIAKATIVDCIEVENKFKEFLKNKDSLVYLGAINNTYKKEYGFKLSNIEMVDPIKINGKLSFWDYDEKQIMEIFDDIHYGWFGKDGALHKDVNDSFFESNYLLQSPEEVCIHKLGICWDQVELSRNLFNPFNNVKTFFIYYNDNKICQTHTFITYENNNKFYWFEHSWEKYRGIHEYSSLKELLLDVKLKFIKSELPKENNLNCLSFYEYKKPKYHISTTEFIKHCQSGKKVNNL